MNNIQSCINIKESPPVSFDQLPAKDITKGIEDISSLIHFKPNCSDDIAKEASHLFQEGNRPKIFNRVLDKSKHQFEANQNDKYGNSIESSDDNNLTNNKHQFGPSKIFTTTIIQKKKNINFKVIKNNESVQQCNNIFSEGLSKNCLNDLNQNEKNNIKYFHEREGDDDKVDNENKQSYLYTIEKSYYPHSELEDPLGGIHYDYFTCNQINEHWSDHHKKPDIEKKVKIKQKESINYLDILINAADKIIEQGHIIVEACDGINEEKQMDTHNDMVADSLHPDTDCYQVMPGNEEKKPLRSETCSNASEEDKLKRKDSKNEDKLSKSQRTRCGNKTCSSHILKKKTLVIQKKIAKGKYLWLCQNCIKAWNCRQYCYICLAIYPDNNINSYADGKEWIQCDLCTSWQHVQCEEKKGDYVNFRKLLQDEKFKYYCPQCRENKKEKKFGKFKKKVLPDQNCYRKEYDFCFKYSNSKRIREKLRQYNIAEGEKIVEKKSKKRIKNQRMESSSDTPSDTHKRKKSTFSNASFLNECESSRELIHDIHKIQDKMGNPSK